MEEKGEERRKRWKMEGGKHERWRKRREERKDKVEDEGKKR